MTPLAEIVQDDWEAGAQKDIAPNLIDQRGFLEGVNTLLDYNGLAYKRGGSKLKSNAPFASGSLRFLWDGELGPGHRTVFGGPGQFGVLAGDDATPITISSVGLSEPMRAVVLAGLLFIGNGVMYGGSRKTAAPSNAGTIAVTNGSKAIVGSGTTFTEADAGMLLRIGTGRVYAVGSVTDNTHLTLTESYQGSTDASTAYVLSRTADLDIGPYYKSNIYAVVANRLVVAIAPNVIRFSKVNDPHTYKSTDFYVLPEGVSVLGMAPVAQDLLIFTTKGIWLLRGLAYEMVDPLGAPQQSLTQVSDSIVLWGSAGLAPYSGGLIVPTVDGVVVVDASGVQSDLGRYGVRRAIARLASLSYKPGGAFVYRDHYFLPVLDAANNWITTFVCRLDLPVRSSRRPVWPWTQLAGAGGEVSMFALRPPLSPTGPPQLLAAALDGYIVDVSGFLEPDETIATDHDGSAPEFDLVTRDYPTVRGGGATGRARKVRVLYEMIEAQDGDDPQIELAQATAGLSIPTANWDEIDWDDFDWQADDVTAAGFEALDGTYGPDDGVNKAWWNLAVYAPYIRFRIRSTDPVAKLSIRALELLTVEPGSARRSRSA